MTKGQAILLFVLAALALSYVIGWAHELWTILKRSREAKTPAFPTIDTSLIPLKED